MDLDSLKHQIRQMQGLKINAIYVLNSSQRNILDDVVKKLDGYVCIPRKPLEDFDTEKWLDEHQDDMFENYPPIRDARAFKFEDMLRYFIRKELLEESK